MSFWKVAPFSPPFKLFCLSRWVDLDDDLFCYRKWSCVLTCLFPCLPLYCSQSEKDNCVFLSCVFFSLSTFLCLLTLSLSLRTQPTPALCKVLRRLSPQAAAPCLKCPMSLNPPPRPPLRMDRSTTCRATGEAWLILLSLFYQFKLFAFVKEWKDAGIA